MSYDTANIDILEPEQLSGATDRPLPRRKLSRATVSLLWLLRLYVFIAIPVVGYAFVHALHASN
jgi:hypothetical protein